MTATRLYLAGPMTGRPEYNFPAFMAAARELRSYGFVVFNPAERDVVEDGFDPTVDPDAVAQPLAHYLRHDLPAVLESDAVVVLDGWERSRGACLETLTATTAGMAVLAYRPRADLTPIAPAAVRAAAAETLCGPVPAKSCRCGESCAGCAGDGENGSHEPGEDAAPVPPVTVLDEAHRITARDRQDTYGHPAVDFGKVAGMATALFARKLVEPWTARDHVLYMGLVKLARLEATPGHRDSLVDLAGYARTYEMVDEHETAATAATVNAS